MTANQRFKQRFDQWLGASMVIAVALHFCLFAFWPTMAASDVSFDPAELEAISLPPEVPIPPAPEAISKPATPVVSEATIDQDITIAETLPESNLVNNLPPPPTSSTATQDISEAPRYTPFEERPRLLNQADVVRSMERNYPTFLNQAGIGGTVEVWFLLDVDGSILKTQLKQSSGRAALDEAALKVAGIMEFTPAKNRDRPVQVWVSQPITFTPR
ncbi:MAG TPA: energy transducer TonB [Longimicrobiales bacterium]|nr:energy transducer TonB [Longimicrobiales bacterium]